MEFCCSTDSQTGIRVDQAQKPMGNVEPLFEFPNVPYNDNDMQKSQWENYEENLNFEDAAVQMLIMNLPDDHEIQEI